MGLQSGSDGVSPVQRTRSFDNAELNRLAPQLVGQARRGVVGSSRYARALRDNVREASLDPARRPVLITGEPGLEKDNLAALIHFGSSDRTQLMVRFDGALLRADGHELFADAHDGGRPLLELLEAGALLIDKLDQVPHALQALYIAKRKALSAKQKVNFLQEFRLRRETKQPLMNRITVQRI